MGWQQSRGISISISVPHEGQAALRGFQHIPARATKQQMQIRRGWEKGHFSFPEKKLIYRYMLRKENLSYVVVSGTVHSAQTRSGTR